MNVIRKSLQWFVVVVLLLTSLVVFCYDEDYDKEAEIDCVNDCGETVEEWKRCAAACYGDFMDPSDHTFLACETDCVDRFYKPDVPEDALQDLEVCAQKCVDAYRAEQISNKP